nr:hypothetical protein [Tanacetum cinerariifolium]
MDSESTSSQQSSHLSPSSKVKVKCKDGIIAFNNAVTLLEHTNNLYHPMLGLLSNSKLSQEPESYLILSSEKVNADETIDKSSSRTSVQPVTQPKAPTDLKPKTKKIPPSSKPNSSYNVRVILPKTQVGETQHVEETVATVDATKSLDTSESAEEQVNHPRTAEAEKVIVC